jgi:hypothetical protein
VASLQVVLKPQSGFLGGEKELNEYGNIDRAKHAVKRKRARETLCFKICP